ncbi:MAG: GGDEF domain-containing protein [Methylococcales bacterium]|nr:GGDEF domain-containing protein [Methylococcales bacterium]MDD5755165.1 GGDEF domain-containing protein [Methylococcales bacterium]
MSFVATNQIFSWMLRLTSQQDYQSLTHEFLNILQENPHINEASGYEIYNHKRKISEGVSVDERLIRRFPLDFTKEDEVTDNARISDIAHIVGVSTGEADENGCCSWAILTVKGGNGPDRSMLIEGKLDVSTLETLQHLCGIYQNLVVLHDAKERDVLTTLPNRQSLDSRLMQVCQYYCDHPIADKTNNKSSWIAILDIDHFKRVNDNFGHLYGDEVLLIFSQIMGRKFRYNDFLFRFGGEEFVVVLNLATQETALTAFNRFREAIEAYHFPTVGKVTVSIGITHIDHAAMPSILLDRADKALYYAKEHGRNQVVLYELTPELVASEHDDDGEIELF